MTTEGKKILIVDDEPDVHTYVQAILSDGGYIFLTARDGEEGVNVAKAELPDVVILDVQMPKKDGFQVFEELSRDEATKAIPVIMLTAIAERTGMKFGSETMGEYFGGEPAEYIDKPIDPDGLRAAVEKLIGEPSAD